MTPSRTKKIVQSPPKTAAHPSLPAASEAALHKAVATYLDAQLRPPVFWSTIPAGGGGMIRGANLKRLGLKPGLPDLMIFAPGGKVLGIELKRPGKASQSPEQKSMQQRFVDCGLWYVLARSVDEVKAAIKFVMPIAGRDGCAAPLGAEPDHKS